MGRRALLLVAAVLLAAVGTGALYLYVTGRTKQVAGTVQVIVPAQPIPAGTKIDETGSQFTRVDVPAKLATDAGYLTGAEGLAGLLATRDLPALTPVTAGQFGETVSTGIKIPVDKDSMNIAVDLDEAARVGGFITSGSPVAVWVIDPEGTAAGGLHRARIVLPKAIVVTTGSKVTVKNPGEADSPGDPAGSIVVLQVKQAQAAALLLAQASGDLYLTQLGGDAPASAGGYIQRPDGSIVPEPAP